VAQAFLPVWFSHDRAGSRSSLTESTHAVETSTRRRTPRSWLWRSYLIAASAAPRAELAALEVDRLQLRDSRWVIPDLVGKGNRLRTVPVPAWAMAIVDDWLERAGIRSGPVFRPLNKAGRVFEGHISEDTVWNVVRAYGRRLDQPAFAPHDLRRTCAKLCRASGGDLEQIQFLLGHASVQTTEHSIGTRQNLVQAVNDHLPVAPELAPRGL